MEVQPPFLHINHIQGKMLSGAFRFGGFGSCVQPTFEDRCGFFRVFLYALRYFFDAGFDFLP